MYNENKIGTLTEREEIQKLHDEMNEGRLSDEKKLRKFNELYEIANQEGSASRQFEKKKKRIMKQNAPHSMRNKHKLVKLIAYVIGFFIVVSGLKNMTTSMIGIEQRSFLWSFVKFVVGIVVFFVLPRIWEKVELYQYNYTNKFKVDTSEMTFKEKMMSSVRETFGVNANMPSQKEQQEFRKGQELANKMGLWHSNDNEKYLAVAYEDDESNIYFNIKEKPARLTVKEMLDKSKNIKDEYGIVSVRDGRNIEYTEVDGQKYQGATIKKNGEVYELPKEFTMLLMKHNPLESGFAIKDIDEIEVENDGNGVKVYNAINIDNQIIPTELNELAGILIGGIPGSGKSAFLITLCSALLKRDLIDLTIIDLKGGSTDWNAFDGLANIMQLKKDYTTGETNLEEIKDVVTNFADETEKRMETFKKETGETNFWHVPVSPKNKIRMIVLDECQEVFNETGKSRDEREIMQQITSQCTRIVKKHRSLGGVGVFATQRPDRESVPMDIRTNCGLRIAFKLTEESVENLTLGEKGVGEQTSALDIGNNLQGTAVLSNGDDGKRTMVRYAYIGGKDLENEMQEAKNGNIGSSQQQFEQEQHEMIGKARNEQNLRIHEMMKANKKKPVIENKKIRERKTKLTKNE